MKIHGFVGSAYTPTSEPLASTDTLKGVGDDKALAADAESDALLPPGFCATKVVVVVLVRR